jgi:phytoene synthase
LLEFCSGMRHDLNGDVIEDEQDLERYCQNVGGAVGALFARMVGTSHPDGEDKLALLGRAFQRTHILRDIDEDHGQGRLYIARSTIERFGCPAPGAREDLLRDQIARAELLYEAGIDAIPLFPSARRAIALAVSLYREILRQIERDGYGRTPGRVAIPAWRTRLLTYRHRYRPSAG